MKNKERILEYLREKDASPRELTVELWIQTPQEYIRQLKQEGHNILTLPVEGQKYSRYHLVEDQIKLVV